MSNARNNQSTVSAMSDVELLAIYLRNTDALSANQKALKAIGNAGSLRGAIYEVAEEKPCISDTESKKIQAGIEIAKRVAREQAPEINALTSPDQVRQFLNLQLSGLEREVFAGIFLDNRHRVVAYKELSFGTVDSAAVYPREIVKAALSLNCAALIFAHNHPSGVAEPSDTDVRLTRKLIDALALVDVRVLDHLVIGQGVQTSMAERGLM